MQKKIDTVRTLIDAFPFIKMFRDQIVVIKYGGAAQTDPKLKEKFARDIAFLFLLGLRPVIVHGGGKKINTTLEQLGIETSFEDGQRVTTKENMEVVAINDLAEKNNLQYLLKYDTAYGKFNKTIGRK